MGKKIPSAQPKPERKHGKKVIITETQQEPDKTVTIPRNKNEPLKSALKKKATIEPKNELKNSQDEQEKSKEDSGNNELDSVFLNGFEDEDPFQDESDQDSSDDDQDQSGNQFKQTCAFDSKDLPSSKTVQNNKPLDKQKTEARSGVIYLGRIPHGFYEEEMKSYFNQFGEVVRLRLSRSKRTGKPKHYGFIEFKHFQVAQIVAETLNNYLLCGNLLQCQLLDPHQIHSKLWVGAGSKFMKDPKIRLRRQRRNAPKTSEQQEVISNRLIEREKKKRKRLAELGIDYDFPGYVNPKESQPSEEVGKVVEKIKKSKKVKHDNQVTNRSLDKTKSEKSKHRSKKSISSTG